VAKGDGAVAVASDAEAADSVPLLLMADLLLGVLGVANGVDLGTYGEDATPAAAFAEVDGEGTGDGLFRCEGNTVMGTGDRIAEGSLIRKIAPVLSGSFEGCSERLFGACPSPPPGTPPLLAIICLLHSILWNWICFLVRTLFLLPPNGRNRRHSSHTSQFLVDFIFRIHYICFSTTSPAEERKATTTASWCKDQHAQHGKRKRSPAEVALHPNCQ
jgi:hypothetical protein